MGGGGRGGRDVRTAARPAGACGEHVQTLLDQKGTAAARGGGGRARGGGGAAQAEELVYQANGLLDNPVFEPRGPKAEQHGLGAIGGFLAATMGRQARGVQPLFVVGSAPGGGKAAIVRALKHQLDEEPPVEAEGATAEERMLTPERLAEPTAPRLTWINMHGGPRVLACEVPSSAAARSLAQLTMRTLPRAVREHAAAAKRTATSAAADGTADGGADADAAAPEAAAADDLARRRSCCSCTIPTAARRSARSSGGARQRSTRSATARRGASSSPASR